MKTYLRFLGLGSLMLVLGDVHAQDLQQAPLPESQVHPIFLGARFGRTLIHLDTRMRGHNRFGAAFQLPVERDFIWNVDLEYYEADGAWGARTFEYKAYTLLVQNVQYVTAYALDFALSKRTARFVALGLGLSVEYFRVDTIVNDKTFPFYIDPRTDTIVPWGEERQTFHFLAPGLFLVGELYHPLGHSWQVYLKQQVKAAYIGKNYHAYPLDSWITFTVYGGVRVRI